MHVSPFAARFEPPDPEIPVTTVFHDGLALGHVTELPDGELRFGAVVYQRSGRRYFAAMAPTLASATEIVLMHAWSLRPC